MSISDPDGHVLSPLDHSIPKVYFTFYLSFSLQQPEKGLGSLRSGIRKLTEVIPFITYDVVSSDIKFPENVHCIRPPSGSTQSVSLLQVRDHSHELVTVLGSISTCTGDEELEFSKKYAPLPTVLDLTQPQPAIRFAANIMKDGILLGVSFNHLVFDGTGVGNILGVLSHCCSGAQSTTDLHEVNMKLRQQLCLENATGKSVWKDFSASYSAESPLSCLPPAKCHSEIAPPFLESFRFNVPDRTIRRLKGVCTALLSTNHQHETNVTSPDYISCHDVLTSLLAVCLRQDQVTALHEGEYTISFAANLRPRMRPPWPDLYLGNMVAMLHVPQSSLTEKVNIDKGIIAAHYLNMHNEDLIQVANTAAAVRQEIRTLTDPHIRSLITYLRLQRDWGAMNIKGGHFSVTSLRHLNVYSFNFGRDLGTVADFRLHVELLDGFLCVVLPKGKHKAWDIQCMLQEEQVQAVKSHRLFRWLMSECDGHVKHGYCASPLHGTMD
ncbi:O-acetyltransferase [Aspergillus aculeatinus CBS 121060]|uniref:O-acetyltransferase n=1 Tax=Aspergillus aculeatinus CBS 121060 TaxID=1448322 RepID=A0ACD1HGS9_9EURO|nr:O-acetyltransferase [Aspergillus aculeatinus CBS 121060]RAH72609.1 O-acetyltransferase [Aspergillus aculeatinus CBS 121060]